MQNSLFFSQKSLSFTAFLVVLLLLFPEGAMSQTIRIYDSLGLVRAQGEVESAQIEVQLREGADISDMFLYHKSGIETSRPLKKKEQGSLSFLSDPLPSGNWEIRGVSAELILSVRFQDNRPDTEDM